MLRRLIFFLTICLFTLPAAAQEALNLPADLFVLLNDGRIERYGVGASGVRTVTPEGAYIIDFGVDAMGERLAYRTENGLFITLIPANDVPLGDPIRLEAETASVPYFRGAGETIAWSPAGDALAYTTLTGARVYFQGSGAFVDLTESPMLSLSWSPGGTFLAAQAEQNVWWIYRREGNLAMLTSVIPSSIGTAWVSDSELVFAPADGSLRVMNLSAANAQSVLLDDTVQYRLPYLTDEDALVFFSRDPEVPEGYGVLMRLQRGATEVETMGQIPVALTGLRWTPDGSLLVAFQGGVLALYDPITGLGFPLPLEGAVAYGWGRAASAVILAPTPIPMASQPAVTALPPPTDVPATTETPVPAVTVTALTLSSDAYFLSADINGTLQVWRMPANGAPPGQFTGSLDDVGEYTIAPNDGSVAYVVTGELWIQPFSRAAPYYLADITSFAPTSLIFSPDGALIAFADEERGIFTVPADASEEPSLLIVNAAETIYRRPQFSPDGSRMLVDIYRGERVWTGVFDLTTKTLIEAPVPGALEDTRAARSRWLLDGRAFTYADAAAPSGVPEGFYVFDPMAVGAVPAQWIPFDPAINVRSAVEVLPGVIRAIVAQGDSLQIADFDLSNGQQTSILSLDASLNAPRISPNGRFVAGYENVTDRLGMLTVVDLQNERRYQLTTPETSTSFAWRGT